MKSPLTTSLLQTIENASPVRAKLSGNMKFYKYLIFNESVEVKTNKNRFIKTKA